MGEPRRTGCAGVIVTLMALCVAVGLATEVRTLTADRQEMDVSVWIRNPYVAAGDSLQIEVGAFGERAVKLHSVEVFARGRPVVRKDVASERYETGTLGKVWAAADFALVELPVPATETMALRLDVTWQGDGPWGDWGGSAIADRVSFEPALPRATIELEVPVRPRRVVWGLRALAGLAAVTVWAAAFLLFRRENLVRVRHALTATWLRRTLALAAWAAVSYWWFGSRALIATGLIETWLQLVAMSICLAAPFLGVLARRRGDRRVPIARVAS